MSEKLTHEEYVRKAIISLRKKGYKGIHSVFSGFNKAFRAYFEDDDPVEIMNKLAQERKVVIRPAKKGVMIYLPEDAPPPRMTGDEALKKMGL